MKKNRLIFGLLCIVNSLAAVDAVPPADIATATVPEETGGIGIACSLSQGYRRDKLTWSISGPRRKPNILSELKYKHMNVYNTTLNLALTKESYFLKTKLAYGVICSGSARDSDYFLNNRKGEYARSYAKIRGDYTIDADILFGKDFSFSRGTLSPSIGYGFYEQKIRIKHGHEHIHWLCHTRKKIHGLNSSYRARWFGPHVGIKGLTPVTKKIDLFAEYDFFFCLRYLGNGHWNLRSSGDRDFKQSAPASHGFGHLGKIGAAYRFTTNWSAQAEYELMHLHTRHGRQYKHHRNIPFRKAVREASEIRLTVCYAF